MSQRFLRQLGLVDQSRLANLRILVSGTADGVADLVVMLQQLGAASQRGQLGLIVEGEDSPTSIFWQLAHPKLTTIEALTFEKSHSILWQPAIDNLDKWDVHLSLNGSTVSEHPITIYGQASGPRAILALDPIGPPTQRLSRDVVVNHPLTPSMRVACAAAMAERMLDELQLRTAVVVSDAWITVTCRVETTDLDEALALVHSKSGMPVIMTPTSDGLATLARTRLPYPSPFNPFDHLNIERTTPEHLPRIVDLGLLPWDSEEHDLDQTFDIPAQSMAMLGVGGLGSWSAPLLVEQMNDGELHVVDGDASIEVHNLNRQVLYNEAHVGQAKAEIAAWQLSTLNRKINIRPYNEFLYPFHVEESLAANGMANIENLDCFDLNEGEPPSMLPVALSEATVFFGCLDNMRARTLLNEAALRHGRVMVNGGSESVHAIVERLSDEEGCMSCRYGKDVAYQEEVISCTEEGARPVASVVTTTAWAGAMMAIYGLIEASQVFQQVPLPRLQWHQGQVQRTVVASKPPWMNEPCLCHI